MVIQLKNVNSKNDQCTTEGYYVQHSHACFKMEIPESTAVNGETGLTYVGPYAVLSVISHALIDPMYIGIPRLTVVKIPGSCFCRTGGANS